MCKYVLCLKDAFNPNREELKKYRLKAIISASQFIFELTIDGLFESQKLTSRSENEQNDSGGEGRIGKYARRTNAGLVPVE